MRWDIECENAELKMCNWSIRQSAITQSTQRSPLKDTGTIWSIPHKTRKTQEVHCILSHQLRVSASIAPSSPSHQTSRKIYTFQCFTVFSPIGFNSCKFKFILGLSSCFSCPPHDPHLPSWFHTDVAIEFLTGIFSWVLIQEIWPNPNITEQPNQRFVLAHIL